MTPNNGVRRRLETPVKIEETIPGYNDRDRLHYPGSPSQYIYESIDSPQVIIFLIFFKDKLLSFN